MSQGFEQFELLSLEGKGATSTVWLAKHRPTGERIAIKVLTLSKALEPKTFRRFRQEVQRTARLIHPGIIRLYDQGVLERDYSTPGEGLLEKGRPYFAMQWVPDGALDQHMNTLDWPRCRSILLSLLEALSVAHARGIIHRDLKPGNVLMGKNGPILSDFGIAFALDETDGKDGENVLGTPHYMSPEQAQRQSHKFSPSTDLYALGCMAFKMVCGYPPFPNTDWLEVLVSHVRSPFPEITPRFPIPSGVAEWIKKLTKKNPVNRFEFAADAAFALLACDHNTQLIEPETKVGSVCPPEETDDTIMAPPAFIPIDEAAWHERSPGDTFHPPIPTTWHPPHQAQPKQQLTGLGMNLFAFSKAPFTGRHGERDHLWNVLKNLDGHMRTTIIKSPRGRGKTALIRWFSQRAHELGAARVLHAEHQLPNTENCGIKGMLERSLGISGVAPSKQIKHLASRFGLQQEDPRIEGMLALLDAESTFSSIESSVALLSNYERFESMAQVLELLTRDRPLILALDDLQWGSETLAFILHLTARWSHLPVFAVAGFRTGELGNERQEHHIRMLLGTLIRQSNVESLHLEPLSDEFCSALVQSRLSLHRDSLNRLMSLTEGEPLYAEQLVRQWIEDRELQAGAEGYRLQAGAMIRMPRSLQDLFEKRLSQVIGQMGPGHLETVQIAATLGRRFAISEWANACRIAGFEAELDTLDRLVEAQLLEELDGSAFRFSQLLFREDLIRGLSQTDFWVLCNSACAEATMPLASQESERVATYLLAAKRDAEAVPLLARAATLQRTRGNYGRSMTLLARQARALRTVRKPRISEAWTALRAEWAAVNRVQGRSKKAERYASLASNTAEHYGFQEAFARAQLTLGFLKQNSEGPRAAIPFFTRGLDAASRVQDLELQVLMRQALTKVHQRVGDIKAAERHIKATLELLADGEYWADRDQRRTRFRAGSLLDLAKTLSTRGRPGEVLKVARRAEKTAKRSGSRFLMGVAANVQGMALKDLDRFEDAFSSLERAADIWEQIGNMDAHVARFNGALVLSQLSRFPEAIAQAEASIEAFQRSGHVALAKTARAQSFGCYLGHDKSVMRDTLLAEIEELEDGARLEPDTMRILLKAFDHPTGLPKAQGARLLDIVEAGARRTARKNLARKVVELRAEMSR